MSLGSGKTKVPANKSWKLTSCSLLFSWRLETVGDTSTQESMCLMNEGSSELPFNGFCEVYFKFAFYVKSRITITLCIVAEC